jgi:hypothetical protein
MDDIFSDLKANVGLKLSLLTLVAPLVNLISIVHRIARAVSGDSARVFRNSQRQRPHYVTRPISQSRMSVPRS